MFALTDVTHSFGGEAVLRGLSLAVDANRVTALIGSSGSGKSTILRLMIGLLSPDSGSVTFAGEPVAAEGTAALRRLRHRVGYVIQDGGLFPHLTAAGNVTLLAEHLRTPADRVSVRLAELCDTCRFPPDLLDRFPAELSGGQRQRVGLMRALFTDPEALLMDEPLGALDPIVRDELQGELDELFGRLGKTVVLVTHDLPEAARLADEIVLLRGGEVVQRGTIDDLLDRPADDFVRRFAAAQHVRRNAA